MSVKVGVVGATGAVGQELIKVLDASPWRPDTLVPLARASTKIPFVEYGDRQVAVDDIKHQELDELDLLFVVVPAEAAREIGGQAMDDGVLTVDCSGAFADDDDVPLLVPWVNPEMVQAAVESGSVALPTSSALLLASILGPLRRAGIEGSAQATVLLPASHWGRDGIDELSKQVVSLFNSATPPRKVFEHGLAFDLIPQSGPVTLDGRTAHEVRIEHEVSVLAGVKAPSVRTIGVPVFSGVSARVTLQTNRQVPPELLAQVLRDAGITVPEDATARGVPRPRIVDGMPFAHAGRIHVDAHGTVQLFVSMDNLTAIAAAAVASGGALLKGMTA